MQETYCKQEIIIYGRVQGVGFRPFVAGLAEELGMDGIVQNAGGIVKIRAGAEKKALDAFVHRLLHYPPAGARIVDATVAELPPEASVYTFSGDADGGDDRKATAGSASLNWVDGSIGFYDSDGVDSCVPPKNGPGAGFSIVKSEKQADALRFLPPDIAVCDRCVQEMNDSKNRRYRYPFISCTACGPRFSIMEEIPYDRETISMRDFRMCPECAAEYQKKGDIRRHAQTIACGKCGPMLRLYYPIHQKTNAVKCGQYLMEGDVVKKRGMPGDFAAGNESVRQPMKFDAPGQNGIQTAVHIGKMQAMEEKDAEKALQESVRLLRSGGILALKDIGGYHFAFDPMQSEPARRLRIFKNREEKPFAVMFPDLARIRAYCEVSQTEAELLLSEARPIVLLKKKKGMDFVPEVCGTSSRIGAFLPCAPLQHLLLQEVGPLVMTSGNRGGEPILTEDADMLSYMDTGVPDAVLAHDRRIVSGLDDSIYQVTDILGQREVVQAIRRARGLVPEPVPLSVCAPMKQNFRHALQEGSILSGGGESASSGRFRQQDVFAAGGDLKAVFALGRGHMAYLSGHFGDLDDARAAQSRREAIGRMGRLLGIHPTKAVCDLHPRYVSAAQVREDMKCICAVQHHKAHVAAVAAEFGLFDAPFLGVAYDGTGYGEDGTVWGGEVFFCHSGFVRVAHLESVCLAGGDASAKNAAATAFCYLNEAERRGHILAEEVEALLNKHLKKNEMVILSSALEHHINTVYSSSMGRLFDAAAAVLGICCYNTYEGECPQRLQELAQGYAEQCADLVEQVTVSCAANDAALDGQEAAAGAVFGKKADADRASFEKPDEGMLCGRAAIGNPDVRMLCSRAAIGKGRTMELRIRFSWRDGMWIADTVQLMADLVREALAGTDTGMLAYGFHLLIARMTVELCELVNQSLLEERAVGQSGMDEQAGMEKKDAWQSGMEEETRRGSAGIKRVALGGGTMYNSLLLQLMIPEFEKRGYQVYVNEKVPSGDGGLAYGQLAMQRLFDIID